MTDEAQHYGQRRAHRPDVALDRQSSPRRIRARRTHTNTVEGFFSLLKRGIVGTFHHIGIEHLNRYCDEFAFRYSHRKVSDGARAELIYKGSEGKRLTYKQPASVS